MWYVTDLEKYEMCVKLAKTKITIARVLIEEYGKDDCAVISNIKQGKEAYLLAIEYKRKWEEDKTSILKIVA